MRLRSACTLIALYAVLLTSGCCWDRCCCHRHWHERECGCACEASCYAPAEAGIAAPPLAPVVVPAPTPLMPGGTR